jgi:hypothetical protein
MEVYQSLDWFVCLSVYNHQTLLNGRFDLPQICRMSHTQEMIGQFRKDAQVMLVEIGIDVRVAFQIEIFAAFQS